MYSTHPRNPHEPTCLPYYPPPLEIADPLSRLRITVFAATAIVMLASSSAWAAACTVPPNCPALYPTTRPLLFWDGTKFDCMAMPAAVPPAGTRCGSRGQWDPGLGQINVAYCLGYVPNNANGVNIFTINGVSGSTQWGCPPTYTYRDSGVDASCYKDP